MGVPAWGLPVCCSPSLCDVPSSLQAVLMVPCMVQALGQRVGVPEASGSRCDPFEELMQGSSRQAPFPMAPPVLGNGRLASEDLQLPDFINVEEARSLTLSEMQQNTLCSLLPSFLVSQDFHAQEWLVPLLWVVLLAELGMGFSERSVPLNHAGVLCGNLTQVSEGTCLCVHAGCWRQPCWAFLTRQGPLLGVRPGNPPHRLRRKSLLGARYVMSRMQPTRSRFWCVLCKPSSILIVLCIEIDVSSDREGVRLTPQHTICREVTIACKILFIVYNE